MVNFDDMKKKAKDAVNNFSDDTSDNDKHRSEMKSPNEYHEDRKNSENTIP